MPTKKSTRGSKFGVKRRAQRIRLEEARRKRWNRVENSDVVPEGRAIENAQSATAYKFQKHEELLNDENRRDISSGDETSNSVFRIIDISLLSTLVSSLSCSVCQQSDLEIVEGENDFGIITELILVCCGCKSHISSCKTSREINKKSNFELTKRVVTSMVDMGVGFAGLQKFCTIMGMKGMHHKTFNKHCKVVSSAASNVADKSLQLASKIVRDAYSEVTDAKNDDIIDICVSYDGTWMKRGHTSNFGIGIVIDLLTGLILDYEVMSKYCHSCIQLTDDFKKSDAYEEWKKSHICDKNFDGSSGSMEMSAAMILWKRSMEKYGFRYVTLLSDGDSKTFLHLTQSQVYGNDHPIQKEECINHVAKRMGTALRKISSDCHSKGISLGGKGRGKLTQSTIAKLTAYYQRAIHNNLGDVTAMKNAIYATIFHAVSTDEEPHHNFCPKSKDSWCFFNRLAASGKPPRKHKDMVGTPLSKDVCQHLLPIYKRLSDEELLRRCIRGKTQNANESLHSVIWSKCPKTSFVHKNRVTTAVSLAVAQFNRGRCTIAETLEEMGVSPGPSTLSSAEAKDKRRKSVSLKRATQKVKAARKMKELAKLQADAGVEAKEGGPSYAAGAF